MAATAMARPRHAAGTQVRV